MATIALVGALVGAVLGLRFKVLTLVPAIAFMMAIVVVNGVALGAGLGHLALAMAAVAVSLQLGYLGGAGAWWWLSEHRARVAAKGGQRQPASDMASP